MATVRELVTQLRYALDRSGADDYVRAGTEAAKKVQDASERAARTFRRLAGGVLAAFSASKLLDISSSWAEMNDRIELATDSQEEAAAMLSRISEIAKRSRNPIAQVAEAMLGNVQTLRDMGLTTDQAADFTEALSMALDLSAIRGQRAESVTTALTRAMIVGKLSGQNLNTVVQNGGKVAEALAEELGVTVSELIRMGAEGKITGDVIQRALINNLSTFREETEAGTFTFQDGMNRLDNAWREFVGGLDKASGVSEKLGLMLVWVSDNVGKLVVVAATVAGAFAFAKALKGLASMREAILLIRSGWISTAFAAAAANWPILLIAAAVGGIVLAVQDIRTWLDGGDSVIGRWVGPSEEWRDNLEGVAKAGERLMKAIKPVVDFVKDLVIESAKVLSDFLGIGEGAEDIGEAINIYFKVALEAVEWVLNTIADIIEWIVDRIQYAWDKAVEFKNFMTDNAVTRAFDSALDYGGNLLSRAMNAETVNSPINTVNNNVQMEIHTSDPVEAGQEVLSGFPATVGHPRFGVEAAP